MGGPYGPYVQSERQEHYQRYARELIDGGNAYECFCSPERLTELRKEQQQRKQPTGYDRRCRNLSEDAREEQRSKSGPPVVRFRTAREGQTSFHDMIRGEIEFDNATLDDFVLLKSDGFPTYHLAHLVDDHLMEISHVLRGDEWVASTPRHMLMYQAFGWEPPLFAHLPIIQGADRARLSKRHGAVSALEYRDQGFLPEAMLNFLGLLGWSLDDHTVLISRDQFIEHFEIERIGKNPAVFDLEKLTWMNGVYLRDLPEERLADLIAERLEFDLPPSAARPIDRETVRRLAPLIRERIKRLDEIAAMMDLPVEDATRRLLREEENAVVAVMFVMDEGDVQRVLQHPHCMIGSDGLPSPTGKPNPRLYGTFPRVLGRYVRDEGLLTLEEGVRRMTSLPAQTFGLAERGEVREGYWADLVVFDPDAIADTGTYEDPRQYPLGISHVLVNGQLVVEDAKPKHVPAGQVLARA